MTIEDRLTSAIEICREAGHLALEKFRDRASLHVEAKGRQDWVSEADRGVEALIRERLAKAWPDDAVVGEEYEASDGQSGFTWVIDPIDGTTNFVQEIPAWCVVLACVQGPRIVAGVIHDPVHDETFSALDGGGAFLNGRPMSVAKETALDSGTVGVGYSNRIEASKTVPLIETLIGTGAMFHRNASGALSLAYVASGRLLGYVEQHMNAWDCLAGQLLIREAGGRVEDQDAQAMIEVGGRVIASAPKAYDALKDMAVKAWAD